MTLSDSMFVSSSLIAREVTLPDGSTHTLHFKELESAIFERFHEHRASENENERYGAMPTLIAASVCEPDGKQAMNVKKAMSLKPKVQVLLSGIIMEINGFKSAKKDSPSEETSGSDTSSV